MPENVNSGFVLKSAYKNVNRKDISRFPITNENLTDDLAIKLIGYHPKGYGLFKTLPNIHSLDVKKTIENVETVINNQSFKTIEVSKTFYEVTKKLMFEPTPFKLQVYYKKLSRKKRDAIINILIGANEAEQA